MEKLHFTTAQNRYKLAPICPCGKSNKDGKFNPDKNNPDNGFCHSCNKTFISDTEPNKDGTPQPPKPPSILKREFIEKSLTAYENNNLIKAVKKLFPILDPYEIDQRAKAYKIGTSKHWQGATVFIQDNGKEIRGGKIMLYDEATAKRIKQPFNYFNWLHTILKLKDFNLVQCLFGLHIVEIERKKPHQERKAVAVVESEKTAFICSLFDDNFIYVATGGKGNFKYALLEPLKGFKIVAFPDSGEFEEWNKQSELFKTIYRLDITTSKIIEHHPKGTDLADLIISQYQSATQTEKVHTIQKSEVKNTPDEVRLQQIDLNLLTAQILEPYSSKTEHEMINDICTLISVEQSTAKEYITEMMRGKMIDKTHLNTYYLYNGVPF